MESDARAIQDYMMGCAPEPWVTNIEREALGVSPIFECLTWNFYQVALTSYSNSSFLLLRLRITLDIMSLKPSTFMDSSKSAAVST